MAREEGRAVAPPPFQLRAWIEQLPLVAVTLDARGRVAWCNEAFRSAVGCACDAALGADWFERFVPSEVRDVLRDLFRGALHEGRIAPDIEVELLTAQGGRRLLRWRQVLLRDEGGHPSGLALLGEDVTATRQEEADRRLMELAIEASRTAVAITGPMLEVTWVNQAFLDLWRFGEPRAVIGRGLPELWQDVAAADQAARELAWSGSWSGEMVAKRADGAQFTARVTINLFKDRPGSPHRVVATFSDLSDRLRLEEQLRQSQKMEAVGLLAGGIAHDFNNLLTIILGGAQFLEEALGPNDPRRADADQILAAARRAEALTRQLLAFSRRQVPHPGLHDLNRVVQGLSRMLGRLIGEDVELVTTLGDEPVPVLADGALLEQALLNLAVNARDAMPDGGRIAISTGIRDLAGAAATALELPPGRYATLAVADTGQGMDEATLARIFEPFFTTKPHGRGTGLGLSTVYGIVRQCGGAVDVWSRPGEGSRFTLLLPLQAEGGVAAVDAARAGPGLAEGRSPVILIAEDEPAVRAVAERCLAKRGYRVRGAANGETALALAREMDEIDLLLTDVVMPGMNGRQLAEAFRLLRPRTPILFMTGYTDDTAIRMGIETHTVNILSKPFTPDGLVAAVEEAMGPGGAATGAR
jgi:two-component system cell cycle sensor histidine kinase/response regulator CckA